MLRVVCCYCKAQIRTKSSKFDAVSHGVCDPCLPQLVKDLGQPMSHFLDQLGPPVLVVGDQGRVIAANAAARNLLSKEQREITGDLGGEVISCRHAREPGGCGQTEHCRSCAIRLAVMHTWETGEPRRESAYPDIGLLSGDKRAHFLIETEKVNDFVLLTLRDVREA